MTDANKVHDFRGVWVNRFLRKWQQALGWGHTHKARISAKIFGIQLGAECQFLGPPFFRRQLNSTIVIGDFCRFRSAQRWGGQVGITRPCSIQTLRPGAELIIGKYSGFSGTVVAAAERIELGEHVLCGANVTITDTDWHHAPPAQRSDPNPPASPVKIGANVWFGMNVIVLKGVTIGDNTVVVAGSTITRDLPANVIAGGQPAKVIRELSRGT